MNEPGPAEQTGQPITVLLLSLLDSFVGITALRDVDEILGRAVDVARLSTRARYGAAVAIERGEITSFIHEGLTHSQVEALPHYPKGLGMLRAVIEDRNPIRIDRLQDDPRSIGFPLNHVPMAAFLGVPIMYEDKLRGALYLTKPPAHGTFSQLDELFMLTLANQAAVALETARLDIAKSEFIANAAHELRTPLTTMIGLSQTLGTRFDDIPKAQVLEYLKILSRQGDRIRDLLQHMLDVTMMETGRIRIDPKEVSVSDVLNGAIETAPPPSGRIVENDLDPELKARADPGRLEQVFVNLLTNSYRFGAGPTTISRRGGDRNRRAGDRGILITVEDRGPGIEPEMATSLFEPFARGAKAQPQHGSGLGLAIVKRLMRAMGGDIWYEPSPEGARFVLQLEASD